MTQLAPDLIQIRLPLPELYPSFPASLPHNVYLITDDEAPALINVGHPAQQPALMQALRDAGVSPDRVSRIVATSWHIHALGGAIAFPQADLFLASPDMLQPRDYQRWLTTQRQRWESLTLELLQHERYQQGRYDAQGVRDFFDRYFPPMPHALRFIPLRDGHRLVLGSRQLQVVSTPGPGEGHICLFDAAHGALFSGEITLDGLPFWIDEVSSYLESQERLMALNPARLYPNRGEPDTWGVPTLRRGVRFLNNFLSNATSALHGAPSLLRFAEQDLGFHPSDLPRFALTMLSQRAFFEELVRARGITASGQGLERRYGVDLEPAPQHPRFGHSPSLMPLGPEDL